MLARFLPILAGLTLIVPAVAVAQDDDETASDRAGRGAEPAVRGDDPRSPTALDRRNSSGDDDDGEDDDDDRRGKSLGNGPGSGIGTFEVTAAERSIDGDFVSFDYFPTTVENASAGGEFLFRVEVTGPARFGADEAGDDDDDDADMPGGVKSRGSVVTVVTDAYRMKAHDNPNALVHFDASDVYAVSFPAGATLRQLEDFIEVLYPDGRTGRLFADGNIAIVGPRVTGDDDFKFMLDRPRGAFDVHRAEIGRAMAKKHVGAEVTIGKPDGPAGKLREEVVTFGDVVVTTRAERGNVTLIVDGHGFDGRVLIVNVDPSLFGVSHKKDFLVLFDNETISEASNFTDAMNPDDDGLRPEYMLVSGSDGVQLVATIPHYSVHTLTLTQLIAEAPPSVVVGFVAGTILVAAGGFVLFRRK